MSTLTLTFKNSKKEIIGKLRENGCKLLQFRNGESNINSPIIIPGDAIKSANGAVGRIVSVRLKNNLYRIVIANNNLNRVELYNHFLPNCLGNFNYQTLKSIKTNMILHRN